MRCPKCKKPLTRAEVALYRYICEDCWASGGPDDGRGRVPRAAAEGYSTKRLEPGDLRRISNQPEDEEEEWDEDKI